MALSKDDRLLTFLSRFHDGSSRAKLEDLLRFVARETSCCGAILWRAIPRSKSGKIKNDDRMFVFGEWFQHGKRCLLDKLPLNKSMAGLAILTNQILVSNDIWDDERIYTSDPFLREAGISKICSIPISKNREFQGTLNLYRDRDRSFSPIIMERAQKLASLVLPLYAASADRHRLGLLTSVTERLRNAELIDNGEGDVALDSVCDFIAQSLKCLEVTLLLRSTDEPTELFLSHTSWPYLPAQRIRYKASELGITSWIMRNRKAVRLLDLMHFDEEKEYLNELYPGITWTDSLAIEAGIRKHFHLGNHDPLPPVSLVAVPIIHEGVLLGVLRCAATTQAPFFFTRHDVGFIEMLAKEISYYLLRRSAVQDMVSENAAWVNFVQELSQLNRSVSSFLSKGDLAVSELHKRALELLQRRVRDTDLAISWVYKGSDSVVHPLIARGRWVEGSFGPAVESFCSRSFVAVEKDSTLQEALARGVPSQAVRGDALFDATKEEARSILSVPLSLGDEIIGAISLERHIEEQFSMRDVQQADLVSDQLCLYLSLRETVSNLRDARDELDSEIKSRNRAYADLSHQVKTPVDQIRKRARQLLETEDIDSQLNDELAAIAGLSAKALRVTQSMSLFSRLAHEERLKITPVRLYEGSLLSIVGLAARDAELMVAEEKNVRFRVRRGSFRHLRGLKINFDTALLEQALGDLMDNASKYCYEDTVVEVFSGITSRRKFYIAVSSKGISINRADVGNCSRRGWRGKRAQLVTGEGTGIGLWIVHNIMRAHRGDLEVRETDSDGVTTVRLLFSSDPV